MLAELLLIQAFVFVLGVCCGIPLGIKAQRDHGTRR